MKDVQIGVGGKLDRLPIKMFSPDMFIGSPSIVMIAKRGSGKSWIVRALLEHFKNIPVGCIIAPTDKESGFYGEFFPETYIHYEFKPETLEKIFARQSLIKDKAKQKELEGKTIDTRSFVVMDDCLASKSAWLKDPTIQKIFFNGRHYEIMYILTMQFPLGITPDLRSNFDYIFLLAEDIVSNQKRIYEHYAGMFPTFEAFRQVFAQLTDDFGAMVIVNRGAKKTFFDKIFWYKAPNLENMHTTFGHKQFDDFHKQNFNEDWKKSSGGFNVDEYMMRKKKNKGRITIDKVKNTHGMSETSGDQYKMTINKSKK